MGGVRIVTDSAADLRPEVAERLGIVVVPQGIRLGADIQIETPSMRSVRFHRRMASDGLVVAAMPPTPGQFARAYARLATTASGIVSIHLSSWFNGTVEAATRGRAGLLGRCQITVIDSQVISRALGILVTEAAGAARDGATLPEIVRLVRGMIPRTYLDFYVHNPDYLRRKGLFVQSRAASVNLAAGPILTMEDGEITPVRRLRGRGSALERLFEFVAEFRDLRELSILHSGLVSEVKELRKRLAGLLPDEVLEEHIYGPALGSYIGPTALGVTAFEG